MFFAYRDFVGDADHVLEAFGFGRAHHRVIHFVHRYPGLKVADLLEVLRITKQSLGRVLKQLLDEGYIVQKTGNNDRRQRLLYATPKGEALVGKLAGLQTDRINRAMREIDPAGQEVVRQFLRRMIDRDDPDKVLEAIFGGGVLTSFGFPINSSLHERMQRMRQDGKYLRPADESHLPLCTSRRNVAVFEPGSADHS